jgi:hypothetical protein
MKPQPELLAPLLPAFSRYMLTVATFNQRISDATSISDLCVAFADYTDASVASYIAGFGFFIPDREIYAPWSLHAEKLRRDPSLATLWRHVHIGMELVGEVFPRVWVYCSGTPDALPSPSSFHLENTAHFLELAEAAEAGRAQPLEDIIGNLRWVTVRGPDLSRRAIIALYSVHRPNELDSVIRSLATTT